MLSPMRLERLKRGLRQGQVADDNDLDQGQYCRFELGKETPKAAVAAKLSKYFGNSVTEMQILYPERFVEKVTEVPVIRRKRRVVKRRVA